MLTGDNEVITKRICDWVGLETKEILLGSEIDTLDPHVVEERIEKTTVFAKLNPMHKSLIIHYLKSKGHTVGYLGDGSMMHPLFGRQISASP